MSAGHTPGPWEAHIDNRRAMVRSEGAFTVARIQFGYPHEPAYSRNLQQREANARLIASAPELLEALEGLVGGKCPTCRGWGEHAHMGDIVTCECRGQYLPTPTHERVANARAAIARATGAA